MKKLKLKIWVEDETGVPVASQLSAGDLPKLNPKDIYTIDLDSVDSTDEIQYKLLINCAANIIAAKFGNLNMNKLPKAAEFFKKHFGWK